MVGGGPGRCSPCDGSNPTLGGWSYHKSDMEPVEQQNRIGVVQQVKLEKEHAAGSAGVRSVHPFFGY